MWMTSTLPELDASPPLVVRPQGDRPEPAEFLAAVRDHREWIQQQLVEHGGLLFRGFLRGSADELEEFTAAAGLHLMPFLRGTTPRRQMGHRIYTSTEVPSSLPIPLHCEMSYTVRHPIQIAFLCAVAPRQGGETPLADMAAVCSSLPASVRRRFEELGVTYEQSVPGRRLVPWRKTWRDMFETDDPGKVESICRDQEIEARWLPGGGLLLRNTRPATRQEPTSGAEVWFNHAHIFHPSFAWELRRIGQWARGLAVGVLEVLLRGPLKRVAFRHSVCYGDGSPISPADIRAVRAALWSQARMFAWRQGDLVLLDNLRIAHARMPYAGPRRILTALVDRVEQASAEQPY